jgi:hypothetical protein
MKSRTTRNFRELFRDLPLPVQKQTLVNPSHPGLNFKKIEERGNLYSERIGLGYRALGLLEGSEIVWFWIGPHGDYDRQT